MNKIKNFFAGLFSARAVARPAVRREPQTVGLSRVAGGAAGGLAREHSNSLGAAPSYTVDEHGVRWFKL